MRNVYIKMDKANRAKQFMPFDALTGFREAIKEKERIRVQKRELSEEEKEELDYNLKQIKKLDMIKVEYYDNEEYVRITGVVTNIDETNRVLKVVDTRISIDDISSLQICDG